MGEEWDLAGVLQRVYGPMGADEMVYYRRDTDADTTFDDAFYALHDLNGNIVMLLDDSGALVEKYYYSPYGTVRSVPYIGGDIDEDGEVTILDFNPYSTAFGGVMGDDANYDARADFNRDGSVGVGDASIFNSHFGQSAPDVPAGAISAFGNTVGYAGYIWEPNLGGNDVGGAGMYQVRFRWYSPTLGRWTQTDPAHYIDGMNLFEYVGGLPIALVDPTGLDELDDTTDFVTGLADKISGGFTRRVRDALGLGQYVRYDSKIYEYAGHLGDAASYLPGVRVITEWGTVLTLGWDAAQFYLQQHPGSYSAGYSCGLTPGIPPPGTPGIYTFIDLADALGRMYVGQSNNISRRIKQHGRRVKPGSVEHEAMPGSTRYERRVREQQGIDEGGGARKGVSNRRDEIRKTVRGK